MAERYDVHAFKCEDNWSLFIWINDTGVKFIGRHADSYEQAKMIFSNRLMLSASPVSLE